MIFGQKEMPLRCGNTNRGRDQMDLVLLYTKCGGVVKYV